MGAGGIIAASYANNGSVIGLCGGLMSSYVSKTVTVWVFLESHPTFRRPQAGVQNCVHCGAGSPAVLIPGRDQS